VDYNSKEDPFYALGGWGFLKEKRSLMTWKEKKRL